MNNYFENNHVNLSESSYGGCISVRCIDDVYFENNIFNNNSAYIGGSVSIYASRANITSSIFGNNSATLSAPAVYINGIYNDTNFQFYISHSIFTNNRGSGSSAFMAAFVHYGLIDNCTFKNNIGIDAGSVAIYYFNGFTACYVNIINSIFINNIMSDRHVVSGGAITSAQWQLFVNQPRKLDCILLFENDISSMLTEIPHAGDNAELQLLRLFVMNCTFIENSHSAIGLLMTTFIGYNNMFISNMNEQYGGAIESKYSWFYVSNCKFINNTANNVGGAISTLLIQYTSVIEEFVLPQNCPVYVVNNKFENNYAQLGGALQLGISNIVENNQFNHNSGLFGGSLAFSGKNNDIRQNTFANDYATTLGGSIFRTSYTNHDPSELVSYTSQTQNDSNSILTNIAENEFKNSGAYVGGAIYLRSIDTSLDTYDGIDSYDMMNINDTFNINNNTFEECYASFIGGGLVLGQQYWVNVINGENIDEINVFNNCIAEYHNDYASYPVELYITYTRDIDTDSNSDTSINDSSSIPPGIGQVANIGGIDMFGNIFESYIISDWNKDETQFEFAFLPFDSRFEIKSVDSGTYCVYSQTIAFCTRICIFTSVCFVLYLIYRITNIRKCQDPVFSQQ